MQNFIGNNIHALRVNKGLSQTEFAKITGVSQSAISAWERGESTPHAQHVQALIEAIPELVPDDIMSEELGYAKKILLHPNTRKENVIDVPLFGSIAAGEPLEMLTTDEQYPLPVSIHQKHPHAFFLKVEGESMNRTLPNESYALIDPTLKEIHEGKVYAVSVDNSAATIKRIHVRNDGITLMPDSFDPTFEPSIFSNSDKTGHTLKIIGQAVWYTVPYGRSI